MSNDARWAFPNGHSNGMTLRDYMAIKIAQSLVESLHGYDKDKLSDMAYEQADSMLRAAKKESSWTREQYEKDKDNRLAEILANQTPKGDGYIPGYLDI